MPLGIEAGAAQFVAKGIVIDFIELQALGFHFSHQRIVERLDVDPLFDAGFVDIAGNDFLQVLGQPFE